MASVRGNTMKILNIGSMNLDMVYQVDHIVRPGETESSFRMNVFLGGKGLNQSVAAAQAGAEVYQGGMIGQDGQPFLDACAKYGIDSRYIRRTEGPSGHAIIQIDRNAQNSILLFGGANQMLTQAYVEETLTHFASGDILLLQNEVNLLPCIIDKAYEKGMRIALNPSPYNEKLQAVDLGKVSIFLLNEVEGGQITNQTQPDVMIEKLLELFPHAQIVLTLGMDGAIYADTQQKYFQPIYPVEAVDTTAAGDTFTGYFLAGICEGMSIPDSLRMSAKASSIAVSRHGAVPSIPSHTEVVKSLAENGSCDIAEKASRQN